MTTKYLLANTIVFLTNNRIPAIHNIEWFADNDIFQLDEMLQDSVFSNNYVNVITSELTITIVSNHITIDLKKTSNAEILIKKHINPFLSKIRESVNAIGINFIWKIIDEERSINKFSKNLFGEGKTCLSSIFTHADASFGAYMSQSYDDTTRMKLDVKPVKFTETEDGILASFNFHYDKSDNLEDDLSQLCKWSEMSKKAEEIVCLMK